MEISFSSKITKVRLNQGLIFVATKDKIFIYHLDGMKLMDKLEVDDHLGRIVLSPDNEMNPYMIYSQSPKREHLQYMIHGCRSMLTSLNATKLLC